MTPDPGDGVRRLDEIHRSGQEISIEDVQEALQESSQWWKVIFETAGIAMVVGSMNGSIVAASPSFEIVFGYTPEEIPDVAAVSRMTHPDDVTTDEQLFAELFDGTRDHYQLEKRYFRKDGSMMWGRLTVLLLCDPQGEPKFIVAMTQDITESVQAKELAEQVRAAALRREQALELNDNIVQGLVVAKMALEGGFDEKAQETLRSTLEKARSLVSDLLGDQDEVGPGSLVREGPADTAP
jgi:PAS domain S-box-containing protein